MLPRAILFDFNGVIVDDESQHCDSLIATLADFGYPLDRDAYYRDYLGFDDRACFRTTFERMGRRAEEDAIQEAIECKAAHYERSIRASMQLVPGAADFVRAAARDGIRIAIVSGALRREIELVLGEAGLREHVEAIVAAEDVESCKPDPCGYNAARAALGLGTDGCVVVEDSLPGLAAARAAALRCVMVATSHPAGDLAGADLVWTDFRGHTPAELPWKAAAHG